MYINVNPEKLQTFAEYISNFSKNINRECIEISTATTRLAQSMSDEDVEDIRQMTSEVVRILNDSEPALKDLQQKVELYAEFVIRLKAIAKGG